MTAHSQLMTGGAMHEAMSAQLAEPVVRSLISSQHDSAWSMSVELAAIRKYSRTSAHIMLLQRHTNRLPYRRDPVRWRPPMSGFVDGIEMHLIEPGEQLRQIARSVELSAQARFQCQDLHKWLHDSLRWNNSDVLRGDGLDVRTLGLPFPARALLRCLAPWSMQRSLNAAGLHHMMAASEAASIRHAPILLAITGPSYQQAIWSAGRTMLDTWASLNSYGYAVHPYYVVTDMTNRLYANRLSPSLVGLVQASDAMLRGALARMPAAHQLHMLLRVGRPRAEVPRSTRRPVDYSMLGQFGQLAGQ